MADDKHYVPGSFYRIDDRTGFKVRAEKTKAEWTGLIVRDQSWEPRQPQDFVKGVRDDQSVPFPRPRQTDKFQGPLCTTIAVAGNAGDQIIYVRSSIRMAVGDVLNVMLDSGSNLVCTIVDIPSTVSVQISPSLTAPVSVLNQVVDTSAVSPSYLGPSNNDD